MKVNCILLIDDDYATNLYHKIVIEESGMAERVVIKTSGEEALEYFKGPFDEENPRPSLVFLDINMPKMTGWEFLEEYKNLPESNHADNIIVMLSTSSHPDDFKRAEDNPYVKEYKPKPLSEIMLEELIKKYWPAQAI